MFGFAILTVDKKRFTGQNRVEDGLLGYSGSKQLDTQILIYWLIPSEQRAAHRKRLHLVTWTDNTSISCATALTDVGSHDSGIGTPMCRLPILHLQVCQITTCWYLNQTWLPKVDTWPTRPPQAHRAVRAVPEAGQENAPAWWHSKSSIPCSVVVSRAVDLLSSCIFLNLTKGIFATECHCTSGELGERNQADNCSVNAKSL